MELKNKVVVITGGCGGFGHELSKIFVREGAEVVVCDKVCEIKDQSLKINTFACDVTNEENVKDFVSKVTDQFGKVDLWINNAGVWIPHKNIEDVSVLEAKKVLDVNVLGTFICTKYILPQFKQSGGVIVNIISTSALGPRPTTAIYSASKFALNGFTKALREEVKSLGVQVYSVFPGAMKTEIFKEGVPDDFDTYMEVGHVAEEVVLNLKKENPEEELVIKK